MSLDHNKLKSARAGARANTGWKPRAGENRIRVLPPHARFLDNWDALENLAVPFKIHFFKVEGRQTEASRCLEDLKQRCPACDVWRVYRKAEDPALKELTRSISPADQYLFNILDISNLQAGIQRWASNWTCWDKIMEIAANAAWGNVADPANGINFLINMTSADKSRTGFNQYSALPEPTRTTVMEVLQTIPNWQDALNHLDAAMTEPKEAAEISGFLDEMGFPPVTPRGGSGAKPTAAAPIAPAATTAPTAITPGVRPATTSAPPPAGVHPVATAAPQPVGIQPAPMSVTAAAPQPQSTVAREPHYDPGPDYVPKVAEGERPVGAPRCFGDYAPQTHRCAPCPAITPCQMKMLGVE